MLRPEVAEELLTFLPPYVHSTSMVAGGYAADPLRANDIDVWVYGVAAENFDTFEVMIRRHLIVTGRLSTKAPPLTEGKRLVIMGWNPVTKEDFEEDTSLAYEEHPGQFRVIADGIGVVDNKPVQIILTVQPSPLALLRSFDISTHEIGYTLKEPEAVIRTATYTTPLDQPRLTDISRPAASLKRLNRIAPRYGFAPHPDDVKKLEELIAQAA